jgi:hypothetical protein
MRLRALDLDAVDDDPVASAVGREPAAHAVLDRAHRPRFDRHEIPPPPTPKPRVRRPPSQGGYGGYVLIYTYRYSYRYSWVRGLLRVCFIALPGMCFITLLRVCFSTLVLFPA